MRAFKFCWVLVASLLPCIAASAHPLSAEDYDVLTADINGDTSVDILLRPKSPNSNFYDDNPTLILMSGRSGHAYDSNASSDTLSLQDPRWTAGNYNAVGAGSFVIVRSDRDGGHCFAVQRTSSGISVQDISSEGMKLTRANISFESRDVNGDGVADVVVTERGLAREVLAAEATGTLKYNPELSAKTVWIDFARALRRGNFEAGEYVIPEKRNSYPVLSATPEQLKQMPSSLEQPILKSIGEDFATLVISFPRGSDLFTSDVVLQRVDGAWYVTEF